MMKISQFVLGLVITLSVNIAIAGGNTWQKASSEYTKCVSNKQEIFTTCDGKDDYQIQYPQDNDAVYLALLYKDDRVHANMWGGQNFPPAFEWRFHYENGKKIYHALIYRSKATEFSGFKKENYLNVIRLAKEQSCYLGKISRSKNMNVKARKLADNRSQQCPPQYADNYSKNKSTKTISKPHSTIINNTTSDKNTWKKASSEYTNMGDSNCVELIEEGNDDNGGYSLSKCKGKGGYDYYYADGGEHGSGFYAQYRKKEIRDGYWATFHNPQGTIEWRFHYENGKKIYHALIYRLNLYGSRFTGPGFDDVEHKKEISRDVLVVHRLDKEKSCWLGGIVQSKNMNIKARQLADDKNAKCINEEDNTAVTTDNSAENNTDSTDNNTDGNTDKNDTSNTDNATSSTDGTLNNANIKDDKNIPSVRKQAKKFAKKEACGEYIEKIFPIRKGQYYAVLWHGDMGCAGGSGTEFSILSSFKYSQSAKTFVLDKYDMLDKINDIVILGSIEQINATTLDIESWEHLDSDARCCPSIHYRHIITYKNGRWTVVKTEKKIERQ
ncbi:MAG: hypothetical protein KGV56_04820 [Gammaproteobacteria bacterium]|nr:hypothetical protein [Gammaproteobacteria bacterium]